MRKSSYILTTTYELPRKVLASTLSFSTTSEVTNLWAIKHLWKSTRHPSPCREGRLRDTRGFDEIHVGLQLVAVKDLCLFPHRSPKPLTAPRSEAATPVGPMGRPSAWR